MPKFDLYDGHGDLVAHLRGFCSKMRGDGGKDELLMAYFSQSLSGSALEWYTQQDHGRWYTWDDLAQAFACHFQYNLEIIPDRLSLTKLEKKNSESFREYGFRWRELAARVDPQMKESEMVDYFLQALEPTYYGHLFYATRKSFNEVVKLEVLESSERSSEPSIIVKKGSSSDVAEKQERLKVVVPGVANKPIVIVEGACIDHVIIKLVTQLPIVNSRALPWNYEWVTVTYKGKEVKEEVYETQGLTRSGRCFAPIELRKAKNFKDNPVLVKKAVTEEEAEEFLRKMKMQDYSIMEQLKKMPAHISLLSLLIYSDEHRRALMKILNDAHVPDKISVNHREKIANKIFEVNRVTFSNDELPVEGTERNRALYLTVKCDDSVVTWVLVDNGSSENICPLSTLSKLKVEDERIHKNNICVQGFDGRSKDSVGDIILELTIGPVEFTMEFQVLDIAVSYNPLLGLGSSLQGIIQSVSLPKNLGTFGLRFKPTVTEIRRARKLKQRAWVLPKQVPRLSRSFVKSDTRKRPITTIPSTVIDLDNELIERSEKLFDGINMVEIGEVLFTLIKEEIIKQLDAKDIRVIRYSVWLANVVPVPKKDGKIKVCVD
ncbi:uncharacterized protein [Nicotiana sylvestris]|uniref:uncharacterized protein n=1 Tax=Nicotiana sylvestris TaxID=4096 RepID=UPI00388C4C73